MTGIHTLVVYTYIHIRDEESHGALVSQTMEWGGTRGPDEGRTRT